nr:hypothetical protein BaRGS_031011 [Batillaria attramentaria]
MKPNPEFRLRFSSLSSEGDSGKLAVATTIKFPKAPALVVWWLALRTMDRDTRVRIPAEASGIFPTKVGSYPERVRYGPNREAVATQPRFTHFTGVCHPLSARSTT